MRLSAAVALSLLVGGCGNVPSPSQPPTFNKDIAPIVFKHCAPCHRDGQPVPFTLATVADVRKRADAIAKATAERRMPPWLPDRSGPALVDARGLSDNEIATLAGWVKAGMPEGRREDLPDAPRWPSGWQLGEPDAIVTMPRPYTLQAGAHDVYRNVVLPIALASDRYVRAIEFRPGTPAVHHAVVRIDRTRASRARDGADGQPGFDGMVAYDVQDPDGHFLGWAPGRGPIIAPDGMPWRLDRASDLIAELHLMHASTATAVQPSIGLYFTATPPATSPTMIVMGSKAIDIPPGDRSYILADAYRMPIDARLLGLYPHAHYLGRDMQVRAVFPDGKVQPLLRIPRWDFRWQQDYRFVSPLQLPRGTTIEMRYTYDNSEDNPHNPHKPPRRVMAGPQSTDEMGNLGVQLLAQSKSDAARLTSSFAEHAARIDLQAAEMLAAHEPGNAAHYTLLGTTLVRLGRYADAVAPLERARTLDPSSASTENHLGGALLALGRGRDALPHFRRASALAPDDAHLHFNLGRALQAVELSDEAALEYRWAIRLNPKLAEAHQQLATLLFARNQVGAAITHLQEAVDLLPTADAHSDLGGALAQAGRYAEARTHLERALQLDPSHEAARANLARLPRR